MARSKPQTKKLLGFKVEPSEKARIQKAGAIDGRLPAAFARYYTLKAADAILEASKEGGSK